MGSLHAKISFYGFPRTVATTTFFSIYSLFLDVDEKQLITVFSKIKYPLGMSKKMCFCWGLGLTKKIYDFCHVNFSVSQIFQHADTCIPKLKFASPAHAYEKQV